MRSWYLKNEKTGLQVQSFPVLVQSSCSLFPVFRQDFKALSLIKVRIVKYHSRTSLFPPNSSVTSFKLDLDEAFKVLQPVTMLPVTVNTTFWMSGCSAIACPTVLPLWVNINSSLAKTALLMRSALKFECCKGCNLWRLINCKRWTQGWLVAKKKWIMTWLFLLQNHHGWAPRTLNCASMAILVILKVFWMH